MEIKAPDGTTIYRGNGKEPRDFTVNIPESGVYTIVVEARHAKGTIHIRLMESTYAEKEYESEESSDDAKHSGKNTFG